MIFQKRGRWCFIDINGSLKKFSTESEAKAAYGEINAPEEKSLFKEETYSYEQEIVFESEIGSEETL